MKVEVRESFLLELIKIVFTENELIPEDVVAYKLEYLKALYKINNMEIKNPIHIGDWSKNSIINAAINYQDIIVGVKN